MRVLHVVHGYPPSTGGAQWLVKNLSEQLVARHGDEVTVFTTVAYNMEHFWRAGQPVLPVGVEQVNGVVVRRFAVFNRLSGLRTLAAAVGYRLRLPGNDWLRTAQQGPLIPGLAGAVAASRADVILASAFPLLHMYATLAGARRSGTPIVLLGAIHTEDRWGYERAMIYRAVRQADAYIALTGFERDYLTARGVAGDRIAVIGPGVDAAPFIQADGGGTRARYGWGDAPVVALIAKQTARKRFDLLVEAMRSVWRALPAAHLLLAGARTPHTRQIEGLIASLPAEQRSRVVLHSDFPEEQKPGLLAACDVFVLPSAEESFGIAFLEAWAAGKPVVGARVGAVATVIDEGRDGLLFCDGDADDLARAVLELLTDPARRAALGSAGRRKVLENHSWAAVADRVRQVYLTTLERRAAEGETQQ